MKIIDVGTHFVIEDKIRGSVHRVIVDKEDVARSLQVIRNIDDTEYKNGIPCWRIARDICSQVPELRDKYFSHGEFIWSKFFGTRKDYFKYYYYPQKVLQSMNLIEYTLRGYTRKLPSIEIKKLLKGGLDNWLG